MFKLHKNNLKLEESNLIRDIFRSNYYNGNELLAISVFTCDGSGFICSKNRDTIKQTVALLFRTLENLQYLPAILTESGHYIVTSILIKGAYEVEGKIHLPLEVHVQHGKDEDDEND